ncbi:MAG: glycosyltransferase family 4 protein [Candidatus Omnitrophota bacterium]
MKILLISDFFPDPRIPGGASTRVYHLVRELAKEHKITLLTTKWPGVSIDTDVVKDICERIIFYEFAEKPACKKSVLDIFGHKNRERLSELKHVLFEEPHMVQGVRRHDLSFERALSSIPIEEYDLIQVEDSYIAYRLFGIKKKYPHIPVVIDLHNVNALMERRNYEHAKGWRWRLYSYLEWRKMIRYEAKVFRTFDVCLTCSDEDAKIGRSMAPKGRFITIPNGVDTDVFKNRGSSVEPHSMFFLGSNWPPNVDGLLYFNKYIYPNIKQRMPDVKFYIIGNFKGNKEVESIQGNGTILTGYVKDVRDWMEKSAVSIVPLRMGGGTRLKILEALSMGKAIVSTSMGAEGIEAVNGESIILADEPQKFADAVVRLLENDIERRKLERGGRKLAEEKYDWKVVGRMLNQAYSVLRHDAKKVLYVLDIFPAISETFILNEMLELERKGFEITIFARKKEDSTPHKLIENLKAKVIYLPDAHGINARDLIFSHARMLARKPLIYLKTAMFAMKRRDKGLFWFFNVSCLYADMALKYDFSHIHSHFASMASCYAMFISKLTNRPFAFTIHGWYDLYEAPPADMADRADAAMKVITISEYNKKYLVEKFCIPAEKIAVVHCGVDLDFFAAIQRNVKSEKIILSVARLHPVKRLDTLVKACGRLSRGMSDFKCVIVGDGEERKKLESLIVGLGLSDRIHLVGTKRLEEVRELYRSTAVYVLPSEHETMGVTTMEAMASGVPVVSTKIYGIPELVDDGVNGLLIKPGDDESLARYLKELIENDSKSMQFGKNGRSKIEKEFNLKYEVDKLVRIWSDGKN